MRGRELFDSGRDSVDQYDWPESEFDIDDEVFAEAIAAGRSESRAA